MLILLKVSKRDGSVVDYNVEKIKNAITKAFYSVGGDVDYKAIDNLVKGVEIEISVESKDDKNIIDIEDIQDIVENILMKSGYSEVAKRYIRYRNQRELSRNKFFEEESKFLKNIEQIAFKDSEEDNSKRENANVNGNTAMGTMLQYGTTVSKEICKTHILKDEFVKAHEEGDIHIHDLDFYASGCTTTCCQIDLNRLFKNGFSTGHGYLREPQDIMSYAALAAIAIQSNQNDQHGGQSLPVFDNHLAPGVLKTFKKKLKGNLQKYIDFKSIEENIEIDDTNLVDDIIRNLDIQSIKFNKQEKDNFELVLKQKLNKYFNFNYESVVNYLLDKSLKETDRQTYQAMEAFVHNLNTMNSRAGSQTPFSSVNFGTDTSLEGRLVSKNLLFAVDADLGNGETSIFPILIFKVKEGLNYNPGDPNYDLFKLACRVSAKRLFPNFSFLDAPFNLQYYKEGDFDTEATYMGCRTRVVSDINGENVVSRRGNLSFTSVNLPRLGIKHGIVSGKQDLNGFFKELGEVMDLVKDQLLDRYKDQCSKKVKNFPFLMGQGVWMGSEKLSYEDTLEDVLKHGTLTVGFIGLAECLKALRGKHHGESHQSQELGINIIKFMRKRIDEYTQEYHLNFSLIATPAEGLSGRFTKLDQERFGVIEGVTDREYYTNSFHIPVYYKINAYDKIKKEAPYHELTNGGHITYVELDGDPLKNVDAFEDLIRFMKESGIGYGSINHPVDRDPVCGFTGIIDNICPGCGRYEDNVKFERIRRITGYLVGTLDRFNDSKKAEVRDRVKHNL